MTRTDMHTAFKLELDKTNSLEIPAFEPEEIDYWLNKAVEDYINSNYKVFGSNQEVTDVLRPLIVDKSFVLTAGTSANKPHSYVADLNTDLFDSSATSKYLYTIDEECEIEYTATGAITSTTKRLPVTTCDYNVYTKLVDDPHGPHVLHYGEAKPLRLFIGTSVELVSDGNYDVNTYYLRYIKKPTDISASHTTCDLFEVKHYDIVKLAVRKALENIEQPRFRSYSEEETLEQKMLI